MQKVNLVLMVAIAVVGGSAIGCTTAMPASRPASVSMLPGVSATEPADPRKWLALSQIPEAPTLAPATVPSTDPAPVQALLLYARARQAELNDDRAQATQLLEQARQIDPSSFELQYALARLYAAGVQPVAPDDTQLLRALENSARLEPDHLRLQIDLGREYLDKSNVALAFRHFRLALQTGEYRNDDALSAEADFFLAGVLQRQGYLRASLDEYRLLVDRLGNPTMAMRASGELGVLMAHIESFRGQIGELEEKLGEYPQALATFGPMLARDPGNVPLTARVVASLLGCNRASEAVARAASLVEQHPGSSDAVKVLDAACRGAADLGDRDANVANELHRLSRVHPANRVLLYAWIDALQKEGQFSRAIEALAMVSANDPYDPQLLRRRFSLMRDGFADGRGADRAARMLIAAVAQYPLLAEQVEPLWDALLRPGRLPWLTLAHLQQLSVPTDQEQARQFFIAYAEQVFGRSSLAESALAKSNSTGAYPPAARAQLENIWSAGDLTDAQKAAQSEVLVARAEAGGNHELAAELRGLSDTHQNNPSGMLRNFDSIHPPPKSPMFLLERAVAVRDGDFTSIRGAGSGPSFESLMWTLLSSWPGFDPAYLTLLNYDAAHEQDRQAVRVVSAWLSADPENPTALRLRAIQLFASGQTELAQAAFSQLLTDDDNSPEILESVIALQERVGPVDSLIDRLSRLAEREPQNLALAGALSELYTTQHRSSDARRALDAAAAKLAGNPDLLYELSGYYHRAGLPDRSEQLLAAVLKLDPAHAGAANDLGYYWADAGTHLPRAEALVRQAIAAEPHNTAFLDSLGWVLYKRGQFGEARHYLESAATPLDAADPVVLNHLGDTLYRLGNPRSAAAWQSAAARLADIPDRKALRTELLHKLQQLKSHAPVDVATTTAAGTEPGTRAAP